MQEGQQLPTVQHHCRYHWWGLGSLAWSCVSIPGIPESWVRAMPWLCQPGLGDVELGNARGTQYPSCGGKYQEASVPRSTQVWGSETPCL